MPLEFLWTFLAYFQWLVRIDYYTAVYLRWDPIDVIPKDVLNNFMGLVYKLSLSR